MSLDTSGFVQTINASLTGGTIDATIVNPSVSIGNGAVAATAASEPLLAVPSPGGIQDLAYVNLQHHSFRSFNFFGASPEYISLIQDENAAASTSVPFSGPRDFIIESASASDVAKDYEVQLVNASGDFETITVNGLPNGAGPYQSDPFSANSIRKVTVPGVSPAGDWNVQRTTGPVPGIIASQTAANNVLNFGGFLQVPLGKNIRILDIKLGFESGPDPIEDCKFEIQKQIAVGAGATTAIEQYFQMNMLGSGTWQSGPLNLPVLVGGEFIKSYIFSNTPNAITSVTGSITFVEYDA